MNETKSLNEPSSLPAHWVRFFKWISLCILTVAFTEVRAQYDSTYIESYQEYLTGRFLMSRKYATVNLANRTDRYEIHYVPNKTFSAGLGFTYKFLTLNLTTGVYQPNAERGRTRNFDLQIHRYGRKFVNDIVLQVYKGFHLSDNQYALDGAAYYVRPDMVVNALGSSMQYVVNHRKFSYRAAFQQSEFQKKSAGTLLIGAEVYLGRFKGDSTIVPAAVVREYEAEGLDKMRFVEIGPNVGYAYTWVYKKFFLTGAASLSLNAGIHKYYHHNDSETLVGFSPNTLVRVSTGYNVRKWAINFLLVSTAVHLPELQSRSVVVSAGQYRMNFVYRILPDKRVKKFLRAIDKAEKRMKRDR